MNSKIFNLSLLNFIHNKFKLLQIGIHTYLNKWYLNIFIKVGSLHTLTAGKQNKSEGGEYVKNNEVFRTFKNQECSNYWKRNIAL